jgi:hypothetical protein
VARLAIRLHVGEQLQALREGFEAFVDCHFSSIVALCAPPCQALRMLRWARAAGRLPSSRALLHRHLRDHYPTHHPGRIAGRGPRPIRGGGSCLRTPPSLLLRSIIY